MFVIFSCCKKQQIKEYKYKKYKKVDEYESKKEREMDENKQDNPVDSAIKEIPCKEAGLKK